MVRRRLASDLWLACTRAYTPALLLLCAGEHRGPAVLPGRAGARAERRGVAAPLGLAPAGHPLAGALYICPGSGQVPVHPGAREPEELGAEAGASWLVCTPAAAASQRCRQACLKLPPRSAAASLQALAAVASVAGKAQRMGLSPGAPLAPAGCIPGDAPDKLPLVLFSVSAQRQQGASAHMCSARGRPWVCRPSAAPSQAMPSAGRSSRCSLAAARPRRHTVHVSSTTEGKGSCFTSLRKPRFRAGS